MVFYDVIARSEIDMDSTQTDFSLEVKIFILNMNYKQLVAFSISLDSWSAVFKKTSKRVLTPKFAIKLSKNKHDARGNLES